MSPTGRVSDPSLVTEALRRYSEVIAPWAQSVGTYMLADAERRNRKMWFQVGEEIGRELKREIGQGYIGGVMRELLDDQVHLIKSLPLDAAKRVHELTLEGVSEGTRAAEIAQQILRTGQVTEARARLIARTEVARTQSVLTQARAEYVGSEGYIWRTAGDFDVRDSHAEMEGKYVRWDTPAKLSDGTVCHAGQIYNCRCYPEPVIPEF